MEASKVRQKREIVARLAEGILPTPEDIVEAVRRLFITDAIEVLRRHTGFPLEDKMRSVRTTFELFMTAHNDLEAALDRFDSFSKSPEFHNRAHQDALRAVEASVRKEIYAYSALAHSLKDHCHGLREHWEPHGIVEQIRTSFGSGGLHDFICNLRNALHHRSMVEADWMIAGSGSEASSHYMFEKAELRLVGNDNWNANARRFLEQASERIDVRMIAQDYTRRVQTFYSWLLSQIDVRPPECVQDYRRIFRSHRARASRQMWHLMIAEFIKRSIDPYPYLDQYLTPEELLRVQALPHRSREQVDLIVEIVDEFGGCDDATRALVYQLFGAFDPS